jgi:hypothetical protein
MTSNITNQQKTAGKGEGYYSEGRRRKRKKNEFTWGIDTPERCGVVRTRFVGSSLL